MLTETVQEAAERTLKILINDCEWDINFNTIRADYLSHVKGKELLDSVGWHWHNEDEDFSRCVRVWNNKITDYYWSFEKHRYLSYNPGENLYSQQIDPKTMEPIVSYIITPDGVHKYDLKGNIIQRNDWEEKDWVRAIETTKGEDNLKALVQNIYLISKKPYGDLVYIRIEDNRELWVDTVHKYSGITPAPVIHNINSAATDIIGKFFHEHH